MASSSLSSSSSQSFSSAGVSGPFHWQDSDLDDHNFQIHGHTLFYAVLLFSIVLLLTLLLLYARWVCTFHRLLPIYSSSPPPPPPPPSRHHHRAGLPPSTGHIRGLDAESIAGIPIVMYRKGKDDDHDSKRESDEYKENGGGGEEEEEEEECSICLGVVEDGEKVKVLPWCGHCYHSECVDRWLVTHSICPLCRGSFTSSS